MNSNPASAPDLGDCTGLVKSIALRLVPKVPDHIHFDDLVGEGYLGLVEAMRLFNPERQVLFTTYAYPRVRGAMIDYVHRECRGGLHRTCRLPEWLPARSPSPEHEAAVRERVGHVLDRLKTLPSRSQEIIEGMMAEEEFKAVADRLGLGISNAHKLKRLAREELRVPRQQSFDERRLNPPQEVSSPAVSLPGPAHLPLRLAEIGGG